MALDTSGPGEQSSFCVALHEALLDDLRHGHALGERPGAEDRRSRTRFALAQGLWARVPDQRARALELARQAATDAAAAGDAVRRAEILAWLRDRGAP